MSEWLLITNSPDGVSHEWYPNDDALQAMLREPLEEVGVTRFTDLHGLNGEAPEYWPEGAGLLLKVQTVIPEPVTSAWRLP